MPRDDAKSRALREHGALHARPQDVTDPLFQDADFFDARDLVQVKYEMLRKARVDGEPVSRAAPAFGLSRPSFYQAKAAFEREGLPGLLPRKRGPRRAHKLTEAIVEFLGGLRAEDPSLPVAALAERVEERFGVRLHPRTIQRRLGALEKKRLVRTRGSR
jgi:transposase